MNTENSPENLPTPALAESTQTVVTAPSQDLPLSATPVPAANPGPAQAEVTLPDALPVTAKPVVKKSPAKKTPAKKNDVNKTAREPAAASTAPEPPVVEEAIAEKPDLVTVTAKKRAAKKPAVTSATTRKVAVKKVAAKKSTRSRPAVGEVVAGKTAGKKAAGKKTAGKKLPGKKAVTAKAVSVKPGVRKASAAKKAAGLRVAGKAPRAGRVKKTLPAKAGLVATPLQTVNKPAMPVRETVPLNTASSVLRPVATAHLKVVRDSFTMPKNEYESIKALKGICLGKGLAVKKSELLRAGLKRLADLPAGELLRAIGALPAIKSGRKKKA